MSSATAPTSGLTRSDEANVGSGKLRRTEEAKEALGRDPDLRRRLLAEARYRGAADPENIVHQAIEKALSGERVWKAGVGFPTFMRNVVRSLCSNDRKKRTREVYVGDVDDHATSKLRERFGVPRSKGSGPEADNGDSAFAFSNNPEGYSSADAGEPRPAGSPEGYSKACRTGGRADISPNLQRTRAARQTAAVVDRVLRAFFFEGILLGIPTTLRLESLFNRKRRFNFRQTS